MIVLHHLNKSRSKRIIWLLEELGVEYRIEPYQRDAQSNLAPPELKAIHSLGKSPVIEHNGRVIAESGAITEYLCQQYRPDMIPESGSDDYIDYLQWMHFAESSAILPLLLKMFVEKDGAKMNMLDQYAQVEVAKVMTYFNQRVTAGYLVGGQLTGADIMMSFIVDALHRGGALAMFPNLKAYHDFLAGLEKFQKAEALEAELDKSI
ncbi:glutathione S-transferase [uncultured Pseudoteredinibacter sp.]|uniref:glutathione S-transferase family protein n=1 Tax=uncultured Pseudoteredinibacter sp. TaxID=1641701 RepID=UPI00262BBF21|nr:glutathione S-transferase [uncultured Pseudoteredinibacter sp.]